MMKTLRIQQYRSVIRTTQRQRRTVAALGLRRIGHTVEIPNNPCTKGMLGKVAHLVRVINEETVS